MKYKVNPKFIAYEPMVAAIAVEGIPESAHVIYQGRNTLYSVPMYDGVSIIVKEFKVPSGINAVIYTNLRKSKARRSYENAFKLLALGIDTPQPIAYIENTSKGCLTTSYYFSLQSDDETVRDWWEKPDSDNIVHGLAQFMGELHGKGVYHRDLSPGNVLYHKDENGAYRFSLVDLNRMKFDVHCFRTQMNNFKSITLNYGENARLAREYARVVGRKPAEIESIGRHRLDNYLAQKSRLRRFKSLIPGAKKH
jgi:tRNA A-37 threonylcarbamoyl transferase component Bud32